MSICNSCNNTVVGRRSCPPSGGGTKPAARNPISPVAMEFEVETPTNFIQGLDGKSAYDYAREGGYTLSEKQFYKDLAGVGGIEAPELKLMASSVRVGVDIEVKGGPIGGYEDGDIISRESTVLDVLIKLFRRVINPTYVAPSFNLEVTTSGVLAVGSPMSFSVHPEFVRNDAGSATNLTITVNGTPAYSGYVEDTTFTYTPTIPNLVIRGEIRYNEGAIKTDSEGLPYPTGHIAAGTISDETTITVPTELYYGSFNAVQDISSVSDIKTKLTLTQFVDNRASVPINEGTMFVALAYSKLLGGISAIKQFSTGDEILANFERVEVGDYYMYTLSPTTAVQADTYVVRI